MITPKRVISSVKDVYYPIQPSRSSYYSCSSPFDDTSAFPHVLHENLNIYTILVYSLKRYSFSSTFLDRLKGVNRITPEKIAKLDIPYEKICDKR